MRTAAAKPTAAGLKLLRHFLELESAGQLIPVMDHRNSLIGHGARLRHGDGSQLIAAQKLHRDGFARLCGGHHNANRFVIITDCGRVAAA